jgi:hypothetical protein
MSFEQKYLKYKNKYLNLKNKSTINQTGGGIAALFFPSQVDYEKEFANKFNSFTELKDKTHVILKNYKSAVDSKNITVDEEVLSRDEYNMHQLMDTFKSRIQIIKKEEELMNKINAEIEIKNKEYDIQKRKFHNWKLIFDSDLDKINKLFYDYQTNFNTMHNELEKIKNKQAKPIEKK